MAYEKLLVTTLEEKVGILTLNHVLDSYTLSRKMIEELCMALEVFGKREDVYCVIIVGQEKAFCAGIDTDLLMEYQGYGVMEALRDDSFTVLSEKMRRYEKPILAAISGYTLGVGCELAMMCDLIIAAENTKIGLPHTAHATLPHSGATQRLPRIVGKYKAMDMILTARYMDVYEADRIGLVSRVVSVDSLLEETQKIAIRIAQHSQPIVKLAKQAINRAYECSLEEGIRLERHLFYTTFAMEDQKEGCASLLEKRRPDFKNI